MWKTCCIVEISKRIVVNKSVDNLFFLSTPMLKTKDQFSFISSLKLSTIEAVSSFSFISADILSIACKTVV